MSGAPPAPSRVLLLGGSSEIGIEVVRACAQPAGTRVALLGRDLQRLDAAAAQLRADGYATVTTAPLDADQLTSHEQALDDAFAALGGADLVVLAVGVLGERGGMPSDLDAAVGVLRTNVLGAGSLLIRVASRLAAQGSGTLVVMSSVAGEVVRPANVVYGASKAGLDALALGLGDALRSRGVRVLVARPGFVRTRMTSALRSPPLATSPVAVGRAVARGLQRGRAIVWTPAGLRWVMLALRLVPRPVIRRLPL